MSQHSKYIHYSLTFSSWVKFNKRIRLKISGVDNYCTTYFLPDSDKIFVDFFRTILPLTLPIAIAIIIKRSNRLALFLYQVTDGDTTVVYSVSTQKVAEPSSLCDSVAWLHVKRRCQYSEKRGGSNPGASRY